MFIGYLRNNFEAACDRLLESNKLFDIELLNHTYASYPQYCFAAYEGEDIVGLISGYAFEKHIFINVLEVLPEHENLLSRLLGLLIKNINHGNLFFLMEQKRAKTLTEFDFKEANDFVRFMHSGEAVAFNFSNSLAQQVSSNDYDNIAVQIDKAVFGQNREKYINRDCLFANSLKLATQSGFLHSYVVNKRYIKISPWLMKSEAFLDAEKLLRGVLYYRGLKKIFAYAPRNVEEITQLYESYKFKQDGIYKLLYLGEDPQLRIDDLYAL